MNTMKENYLLAKWLNDELTEAELADFKADPAYEKYEKIKNYSAHLDVPDFDAEKILEKVVGQKKTTAKVVPLYKNWLFKVAAVFVFSLGITFVVQHFDSQTHYALNGKRTTF
ncbi:MAG TPA: hypothetical protein VLR29_10095, partial [Flavobacterium sp.]|nr:hypothetical protein [Flavobacterium sp.]